MIHEEIQAARLAACHRWPYLSTGIWAMNVIPTEECMVDGNPTMGVDKYWRLYYHPKAVEQWTVPELTGLMYHEVQHLLRKHRHRAEVMSADPRTSNIAMDAEINDNCRKDCWGGDVPASLPQGGIYASRLGFEDGLLWEEYYKMLTDKEQEQDDSPESGESEGGGSGGDEGKSEEGGGGEEPQQKSPDYGGSCADGKEREWEYGAPGEAVDGAEGEEGEKNPSGVTAGREALVERDIASKVEEYEASGRGNVPAHMQVWAKQVLTPKVCWQKELRAQVKAAMAHVAGQTDYTYRRPARKQDAYGAIIAPAMHSPRPRVAIVVDTSGSMMSGELDEAMAEVNGICKEGGTTASDMFLIACDSQATKAQQIFNIHQADLSGGGGTDMGVGIRSAELIKPAVDICIVLTDGIAPYGDKQPPIKTIIGIVGDYDPTSLHSSWPIPSWAKPIIINKEK